MEIHETNYVSLGCIGQRITANLPRYDAVDSFYTGKTGRGSTAKEAIRHLESQTGDNLTKCQVRSFLGEYWGIGKDAGIVADFD